VDAIHRADVNTRGILHVDARLSDNVSHRFLLGRGFQFY
jgi:hypothetical protein